MNDDSAIDRIKHREDLITGLPPRIPADYSDSIVSASQRHMAQLRTTDGPNAAPIDPTSIDIATIPEMIVTLMSCHPDLYEKVADVSVALMAKTSLPRRDLELAVLRTDWLAQSPYNWGEHATIAKRFGVTSEEIERVTAGSNAPGWTDHDRALLQAAEELEDKAMISDDTWETLAATYSDKQMFELIVLIGQFRLVCNFQNSLRFRLSPGNDGLRTR